MWVYMRNTHMKAIKWVQTERTTQPEKPLQTFSSPEPAQIPAWTQNTEPLTPHFLSHAPPHQFILYTSVFLPPGSFLLNPLPSQGQGHMTSYPYHDFLMGSTAGSQSGPTLTFGACNGHRRFHKGAPFFIVMTFKILCQGYLLSLASNQSSHCSLNRASLILALSHRFTFPMGYVWDAGLEDL